MREIKAVVRHILMHSPFFSGSYVLLTALFLMHSSILLWVICVVDSIVFNQLAVHPWLPT